MAEIGSAFVSLLPSGRGFGSKLDKEIGRDVSASGKRAGLSFGKVFAAVAAVGIGTKVVGFLKDANAEAREAQKVSALTAQVIKSTGAAAGVTAKQVDNLASSISRKTGIDDEQIASSQNLLLTFKGIKAEGGVYEAATRSAVDMGAAMAAASGGALDLKGSTTLVGKALNDPIKGLSALSRVGVTFTEGQKKQIKAMVKSGNVMGAQKRILKELKSEFGGAAAAQATMGDKAKVAWGNFQEAVGTLLLPAVDKILTGFAKVANFGTDRLGPAVKDVIKKIGPPLERIANLAWGKLQTGINALKKLTQLDFSKLDGEKLGLQLSTAVGNALGALSTLGGKVFSTLSDMFGKVDWIGLGIRVGTFAIPFALGLATGIINGLTEPALWQGIWDHLPEILLAGMAIAFAPAKLIGPLARILSKIPFVGRFLAVAVTWVNQLGGKLTKFAGDLLGTFWKAFTGGKMPGGAFVTRVMNSIKGLPGQVGNFFSTLGTRIGVWALDAFEAAGRGARRGVGSLLSFVGRLPKMILSGLGNLSRLLWDSGKNVVQGLIGGIKSMAGDVVTTLVNLLPPALRKFAGKLGIHSPSTVFHEFGVNIVDGLRLGIEHSKAALQKTMDGLVDTIKDKKSDLSTLMDEFGSISSSVADRFKTDLFGGSLNDLIFGGIKSVANLENVTAAFKKLRKKGAGSGFLHALFESGNSSLITELAGGSSAWVGAAQDTFNQQTRLANQLGDMTARNTLGPDIRGVRQEIKELRKDVRLIGADLADALNNAAAKAKRKKDDK